MSRFHLCIIMLLLLLPGYVQAQEPEVKLRSWGLGLKSITAWYNTHDVFGKEILPETGIDEYGSGMEFTLSRRLGDRFLLGGQFVGSVFGVQDREEEILRLEAQFTGTVLFRERETLQPFLRGGVGVGFDLVKSHSNEGEVTAYGTSALFSGGLQVRVSSRLSLELEAASTFINFLEVIDSTVDDLGPDESWRVRDSSWGWRLGIGATLWL